MYINKNTPSFNSKAKDLLGDSVLIIINICIKVNGNLVQLKNKNILIYQSESCNLKVDMKYLK